MVKAISKKSSDVGIGYDDLAEGVNPRGRHCIAFVKLSDSRGLKVYSDRDERDRLYRLQRELAQKGFAPGCDECIDIEMPDGSMNYAYVTVCADIAVDGFYGVPKRTDYADRRGLSECKIREDLSDLKDRMYRAGYDWSDCCIFNFGYCNGRAVLTDCDCDRI